MASSTKPELSSSVPSATAGSANARADHGKHQRDAKILAEAHFAHLTHLRPLFPPDRESPAPWRARVSFRAELATAVRNLRDG